MKINKPTTSRAESKVRFNPRSEEGQRLIRSYFKIIDAQKYPYKNLREVEFYNENKRKLANSCIQDISLFSISEFQELLDYYIYIIRNVDLERIGGYSYWSFAMDAVYSLVRYFRLFVINRKKPWSRKDVANELFVELNLTAKEWVVNRTRNEGRY
jgi:hypothetical protein|tara:strand:- start:7802 stop:8269 length:468 start_codon:yes stop_codon:yes gene_type:complete